MHKETCQYVSWAVEPKWKKFDSEQDARASTRRAIKECGICWKL